MSATAPVEWGVAARALPGEEESGDRAVVELADGHVLAAAVDGLGHGGEAAVAAEMAVRILQRSAREDAVAVARTCDAALRETRGAAVSLASFDCAGDTMTWLGVGNVEGRLLQPGTLGWDSESLLLRGGVVGHELPALTPTSIALRRGDVLIFATDGIDRGFADLLEPVGSCRDIALRILERHAVDTDDALVLVARYLGGAIA